MRPACLTTIAAISLAILAATPAWGQPPTVEQLERQFKDDPGSATAKVALAEAYLRDCQLEKSLKLWREVLAADPAHERAKLVVARLTGQMLDLDSHLSVLAGLLDKKVTAGMASLLEAAGDRAATDAQKATVIYLKGRLALGECQSAAARAHFQAAIKLYPATPAAGWAVIALAEQEAAIGNRESARHLLRSLIDDKRLTDEPVRQQARLRLLLLESADLTGQEKTAALRDLIGRLTDAAVKRQALGELVKVLVAAHGRWTPEAVDAAGQILAAGADHEQASRLLGQLSAGARDSQDPATLDRLGELVRDLPTTDELLRRQAAMVHVEALLARAAVAELPADVARFLAAARTVLDRLSGAAGGEPAGAADRLRIGELRGRALLVEAQKLAVLKGPDFALPLLRQAKDHYLQAISGDPEWCFGRLNGIGRLLQELRQWETAVELYRQIAARFPHLPAGRDALLQAAGLYDDRLDAPMAALELYAEYAARYPAELPYRQLQVGQRLRRLGYANVLDFQRRNNLKPDGLFGPSTARHLEELEASFDEISVPERDRPTPTLDEVDDEPADRPAKTTPVRPAGAGPQRLAQGILRGRHVHPTIFEIARRLDRAGRHREAIQAYRLFLNLYPTKKEADDCLVSIARLFRDNLMFAEALGAYRQLMDDYPNGDATSGGYVEAAQCLENLGRWKEARELYDLYVRKFPKYPAVSLCKSRMAALEQIQQYEDFIAGHPASPKVAEAQYQIASILYKQFANYTKAAVEFAKVAERHAQHVRSPDALFTAATAQLKAENFPAARTLFGELVARYSDSRLADDGQYWIGHTFEYAARALGRLDAAKIVLKRRSLKGRAELLADLELRRFYDPSAKAAPAVPEDIWGGDTLGVLTSGSKRDRVNAGLFQAIAAYRQVVDRFKMGDMAGHALLRIGTIYTEYLNDPDKGAAAYQELLAHYPASKEAVNALFEVGNYHASNKRFDEAIKAFQQFIYSYPTEAKVEDAMLAIARCHADKKAWDKALDAYQSYLNKFPSGRFAEQAKAQVEWIRMYHF